MDQELRFLRNKVAKLEININFLQNELEDKLNLVLSRFFNHRVDAIVKQKRSLQLEEDIYRSLLSSVTSYGSGGEDEGSLEEQEEPVSPPPSQNKIDLNAFRRSSTNFRSSTNSTNNNLHRRVVLKRRKPTGNNFPVKSARTRTLQEEEGSMVIDLEEQQPTQPNTSSSRQVTFGPRFKKSDIESTNPTPVVVAKKSQPGTPKLEAQSDPLGGGGNVDKYYDDNVDDDNDEDIIDLEPETSERLGDSNMGAIKIKEEGEEEEDENEDVEFPDPAEDPAADEDEDDDDYNSKSVAVTQKAEAQLQFVRLIKKYPVLYSTRSQAPKIKVAKAKAIRSLLAELSQAASCSPNHAHCFPSNKKALMKKINNMKDKVKNRALDKKKHLKLWEQECLALFQFQQHQIPQKPFFPAPASTKKII